MLFADPASIIPIFEMLLGPFDEETENQGPWMQPHPSVVINIERLLLLAFFRKPLIAAADLNDLIETRISELFQVYQDHYSQQEISDSNYAAIALIDYVISVRQGNNLACYPNIFQSTLLEIIGLESGLDRITFDDFRQRMMRDLVKENIKFCQ